MKTAQELFDMAFSVPRDIRSPEYMKGVLDALQYRIGEKLKMNKCPYAEGTAQADAWYAGTYEGHRLGREEMERSQGFKVGFDGASW